MKNASKLVVISIKLVLMLKLAFKIHFRGYMLAFFTPESVKLPVLKETFCNPEDITSRLEPYNGPFKDLINDKTYHKGRILEFYPGDRTR